MYDDKNCHYSLWKGYFATHFTFHYIYIFLIEYSVSLQNTILLK